MRRRFLDFVAAQREPGYRAALRNYERALRSRNLLLKAPQPRWREIAAFDEQLLAHGNLLTTARSRLLADLQARHVSVGATRHIGLFGIVELVRNRETLEPMAPFNGTSPEMQTLGKYFREEGLYTFVRWNTFFTNPPCKSDRAFVVMKAAGSISITAVLIVPISRRVTTQ